MKRIILLVLATVIALGVFVGCEEEPIDKTVTYTEEEKAVLDAKKTEDISPDVVGSLRENMKYYEILSLIGKNHGDWLSSLYPYLYSWELNDGSRLFIRLYGDDYEGFMERYRERYYQLPDETEMIDESTGGRSPTKNESRAFKKWMLNRYAVSAYVEKDGETTYLFGAVSQ